MKEIVLATRAVDPETGRIEAPSMVNSHRRGPRYNRPYEDEPEMIAQFRPGECQIRFKAEWDDEKGDWIFGKTSGRRLIPAAAPITRPHSSDLHATFPLN